MIVQRDPLQRINEIICRGSHCWVAADSDGVLSDVGVSAETAEIGEGGPDAARDIMAWGGSIDKRMGRPQQTAACLVRALVNPMPSSQDTCMNWVARCRLRFSKPWRELFFHCASSIQSSTGAKHSTDAAQLYARLGNDTTVKLVQGVSELGN